MTRPSSLPLRQLGSLVAALTLLVSGPSPAAANGIGDLYAGTATEVVELHVATGATINVVGVPATVRALAFSNDGASLYAAGDTKSVVRLDIATISVAGIIDLPAPVSGLAFPRGNALVAGQPSTKRLAIVAFSDGHISTSGPLPGGPTMLTADRRRNEVAAAAAGGNWVAIYDPTTGALRTDTVAGAITALSLDGRAGFVYVATRAPDALVALRLDSGAVAFSTALPSTPTAVTATRTGAAVAGDAALWRIDTSGKRTDGVAKAPITALSVSDDGAFVYGAEGTNVEAFDATGGASLKLVVLAASRTVLALAAIPGRPSLVGGPNSGTGGPLASAGPASSGDQLPTTDTPPTVHAWPVTPAGPPDGLIVVFFIASAIAAFWLTRRMMGRHD